jgi:hypothetical protein
VLCGVCSDRFMEECDCGTWYCRSEYCNTLQECESCVHNVVCSQCTLGWDHLVCEDCADLEELDHDESDSDSESDNFVDYMRSVVSEVHVFDHLLQASIRICYVASGRQQCLRPQVPIRVRVMVVIVLAPVVLAATSFWRIGSLPTSSTFGMTALILCLVSLTTVELSELIKACISTVERANAVCNLLVFYSFLLAFAVWPKLFPEVAKPLQYTSFCYWGVEALIVIELGGTANGEKMLVDLGFVGVTVWHNVLILAGFVLVLRALTFVAHRRIRY